MRCIHHWALLALLWMLSAPGANAFQDDVHIVEVRVTAVSIGGVFIDHGRADGLRTGDQVRFFPLGRPVSTGVVRAVSRTSSRVEVQAIEGLEVGVVGRVRIPVTRLATEPVEGEGEDATEPEEADELSDDVPEHPPWEHPPESWDESMPLLAPVEQIEPEDRKARVSGRAYVDGLSTWDNGPVDQRFLIARSGVDVLYENVFGRGGALSFDGEISHRLSRVAGQDEDETFGRLDRFSYGWGFGADEPRSYEVGRFLQREFPEFGVLDGFEFGQRLPNGDRVGASFGYLPEPSKTMDTGDDLQIAGYYRFVSDPDERVTVGTGFQKTWHQGHPDRDLAIVTALAQPVDRMSLYGSAWVDFYGDGDTAKPDAVELTQLQLSSTYTTEGGHGGGLFASHFRWPDLERDEFGSLTPEQIRRNRTSRIGVNGWGRLSEHVRLSGRFDYWEDQDGNGFSGEIRADLADLLYDRGLVSLSVFETEGQFTSGLGARVFANRRFDAGTVTGSWDATSFEQSGFVGSQETLLHQTLRAGWDTTLDSGWDLSFFAERRFGDQQDSISVGLFVQRRF